MRVAQNMISKRTEVYLQSLNFWDRTPIANADSIVGLFHKYSGIQQAFCRAFLDTKVSDIRSVSSGICGVD